MNLDEAKQILKNAGYLFESDGPVSSSEWYSIAWRCKEKIAEQEDLLKKYPLWPGTPAELKTKNLIKKYKGYYEQALNKAKELEYQEDEKIREMKYYEDLTRAEW